MSTNLEEIATQEQILPTSQETELFGVWREIEEIHRDITRGRPAAIRNAVLSALFSLGGIVGVYETSDHGKNLINWMSFATGAVTLVGVTETIQNKRRMNAPGSFEEEVRLGLLEQREELLMLRVHQKKK